MKKMLKNKKGFTLVELLAVIIILALIMGIALISMSDVINGSKKNSARRTAAGIIDGVRGRLLLAGKVDAGTYYFKNSILEKGGVESPLGGNFVYYNGSNVTGATEISNVDGVYTGSSQSSCTATTVSYVNYDGDKTWTICLTAGDGKSFLWGTEQEMIQDAAVVIDRTSMSSN